MGEPKIEVSAEEQERRTGSDRERDRRVIERVSVPEARPNLAIIRRVCQTSVAFSCVYIAMILAGHLLPEPTMANLTRSVFVATVVAILAYNFARMAGAIRSFEETESKQRLLQLFDRLKTFMFVSVCMGVILGLAQIITWIR